MGIYEVVKGTCQVVKVNEDHAVRVWTYMYVHTCMHVHAHTHRRKHTHIKTTALMFEKKKTELPFRHHIQL